uniref:Neurexin-2-alpha n=1 Tax=Ascaris suum TaxID=6253 RepID=F1L2G3_ASCSU
MPLSPRLADVIGFRGCISSLRIGDEHLDVFVDAEETVGVTKGCAGPMSRCSPSSCSNGGRCIQKWNSVKCDCSMTTYGGSRCDSPGTTYVFDSSSSMIFYEYPPSQRPSTNRDRIAIGFQTRQASAVLLSVQCTVDGDYLTVFMNDGFVQVRYNLGTRDHTAGLFDIQVNDDIYHVLTAIREEANLTLLLDNYTPLHYAPKGSSELFTLNMQWRVSVGASFNLYHKPYRTRKKREKVFDAFHGKMAGVNFNGLMILDLLAQGSPFVQRIGSPRLVHMSSSDYVSGGVGALIQPNLYKEEMVGDGWKATSEGLIHAEGSGCIPYEEQENCQISDPDPAGLITPILPAAESSVARTSLAPRRVSVTPKTPLNVPEQRYKAEQPRITSVALLTTRHRTRTTLASHTVYAVRPTTPMGDMMTSTSKGPAAPTDFPRTALISIASLSVIIIIAIVVFCVFRCRQSGPSTDQYPMVCNGKQSGYAPIPTEMSPQMVHHDPHHVAQPVGGPFLQARVNHLNGYQPIKGAVIPNTNGVKNGNAVSNGRKKEFKEWYV